MAKLLFVEDDPEYAREMTREILAPLEDRIQLLFASDGDQARALLDEHRPELVLLDMNFPRTAEDARRGKTSPDAGEQLLGFIRERRTASRVLILSSQDKERAIDLVFRHREIKDYLFKDSSYAEVRLRLHKQLEVLDELAARGAGAAEEMVGESPALAQVKRIIERVARERASVLILGESGTGKELVARRIHALSDRAQKPFVKLNCAAFAENVLESELFGHVKGAFTGAESARAGRFEIADGGTLFLDEIGEVDPGVQVKLLRFLQEQEFEPVGSNRTRKVDVRLICATNRDLEAAVKAGGFRQDFYYRIRVFPVQVPPLRERREDIPRLIQHFLEQLNAERVMQVTQVTPEARQRLAAHSWPGNIRELENVLHHAAILADGGTIQAHDLQLVSAPPIAEADPSPGGPLKDALATVERRFIVAALERHRYDLARTAQELGIEPRTLNNKLNLHRISRHRRQFDDGTPEES